MILAHSPHPHAAKLWVDFIQSEVGQKLLLETGGHIIGRLGIKSQNPDYPAPIDELKGFMPMDWRKVTAQDRDEAREEFRRIMIEKGK